MPLISVCICTFFRNDLLAFLLNKLLTLKMSDSLKYEIIVVDNDKDGKASEVVESVAIRTNHCRIVYDIEPQQNIALARNRTIRHAQGDYIAFIDDDEYPSPSWLEELHKTLKALDADVVMGPVFPEYPSNTPKWIVKGKFFERPNPEDQTRVYFGRTGNALVRSKWFEKIMFDEKYGLTGGEDSEFFNKLIKHGGAIYWSKAGYVTERVEENRVNLRWLLARAFRGGQGTADKNYSSFFTFKIIPHLGYRIFLLTVALCGVLLTIPLGRHRSVWWLIKVLSNIGQLSILFPYRYKEYRK